ncbi:DEAD/DEAH box helicase family protein [Eubacterium sp.]|jgi:superfamily II DNA or RNA helicase|uniref:DEAD/DEAH box helicase family protein n=1 Tax=Eubacterium sp. TaxID=142586 RepID=UPI002631C072|nr:DEAD/DEAH box helicase family protein [uncultured Eubacterium sp.]
MSFKDININFNYRSDENDITRDFYIPVLYESRKYKRAVGYFSTSALLKMSVGLVEMERNNGKVQIICSPKLSREDIEAINKGYESREKIFSHCLECSLREPLNYFEEERLNIVATMIAEGMLELKIAFMEDENGINLYHEKIGVFEDELGNKIAFTGSSNETENALESNFESIYVFCDWKESENFVETTEDNFDRMWMDSTNKLKIIPFPDVVIDKLMQYKKETIDRQIDEKEFGLNKEESTKKIFKIPDNVSLRNYQEEAIENWKKQNCRGIFSMCTGSGKSFTALACMVELAQEKKEKLATFIVCPYIHLVGQWEEDVVEWGCIPIIAHSKSLDKNWKENLTKAYKRFKRDGRPFICITTNDTFAGDEIQNIITRFNEEENVLLIVDEAHNFGAKRLSRLLPENVNYRIALSATIERHMDKKGTGKIFDYFGDECVVYGLEQAIKEGTLCPYNYYPILVYLEEDELNQYMELTKKLSRFIVEENGKTKISEEGQLLLFKRARLLAGARNKRSTLKKYLEKYQRDDSILVYCGATSMEDEETGELVRQIDGITDMINQKMDMRAHKFTSEENLKERQQIKEYFQSGIYQVITAIKCLDEGVNIPGIKTAFIMSSSRNPKEFIQRRGRLLRKSSNKEIAEIYDFITLPRDLKMVDYEDFEKDKSIVVGELFRINEFGTLANNNIIAKSQMTDIMNAYNVYFDIENEMKKMEDYYD